jgi:hypothetical protein
VGVAPVYLCGDNYSSDFVFVSLHLEEKDTTLGGNSGRRYIYRYVGVLCVANGECISE